MAFHKYTVLAGKRHGTNDAVILGSGHWRLASALRQGLRLGFEGVVTVTRSVYDASGMGRSGHDGVWQLNLRTGVSARREKYR